MQRKQLTAEEKAKQEAEEKAKQAEEKAKYRKAGAAAEKRVSLDPFAIKIKQALDVSQPIQSNAEFWLERVKAEVKKIEAKITIPSSNNNSVGSYEGSTYSLTKKLTKLQASSSNDSVSSNDSARTNEKKPTEVELDLSLLTKEELSSWKKLKKHQEEINKKLIKLTKVRGKLIGSKAIYESDLRSLYIIKEFKSEKLPGENAEKRFSFNPLGAIGNKTHSAGKYLKRHKYLAQLNTLTEELDTILGNTKIFLEQQFPDSLPSQDEKNSLNNNCNNTSVSAESDKKTASESNSQIPLEKVSTIVTEENTPEKEIAPITAEQKEIEDKNESSTEISASDADESANIETNSISSEDSNAHGISGKRITGSPLLDRKRSFHNKRGSNNSEIESEIKVGEILKGTPLAKTRGTRSGSLGHISEELSGVIKGNQNMHFKERNTSPIEVKEFFQKKYTPLK